MPALIEVADFSAGGLPSWDPVCIEALRRYANVIGMPLLIGLKYVSFWTLFEERHLREIDGRFTIEPVEAMAQTLLGLLAGDFSFSFYPGVGFHIKIRKGEETSEGCIGQIEEAYLLNAEGQKHNGAEGIFHLFSCIEPLDVREHEDETHVIQSYVLSDGSVSEFAHRALVTLLEFSGRADSLSWHQILTRRQPPLLSYSPRQIVESAKREGFVQQSLRIMPRTSPEFIARAKEPSD